jgi:hypothetical protein
MVKKHLVYAALLCIQGYTHASAKKPIEPMSLRTPKTGWGDALSPTDLPTLRYRLKIIEQQNYALDSHIRNITIRYTRSRLPHEKATLIAEARHYKTLSSKGRITAAALRAHISALKAIPVSTMPVSRKSISPVDTMPVSRESISPAASKKPETLPIAIPLALRFPMFKCIDETASIK